MRWSSCTAASTISTSRSSSEFVKGYAQTAGATIHVDCIRGDNPHHIAEAAFKALGLATRDAFRVIGGGVPRRREPCEDADRVCDYGVGNLRSVERALRVAGAEPVISSDPSAIAGCDGVILPGVGAF